MKIAVLVAVLGLTAGSAAAQTRNPRPAPPPADKTAEAYSQFLLGHHLEERDDTEGAIAAYKRAIELDPSAGDISAELAGLYLRQNKIQDAMSTAEQALKVSPDNPEANRVLGIVYAAMAESVRGSTERAGVKASDDNVAKAVQYLERSLAHTQGLSDPNMRATLARLYLINNQFDKAIPLLTDLVNQEPGWSDGPMLLAEAYAGAGRAGDAIAWLKDQDDPRLLPTLADFYERERRWKDAAETWGRAVGQAPRNTELKVRYASALINSGGRAEIEKARDVLKETAGARGSDATINRAQYLLSQAYRRLGDYKAAEESARAVIAKNNRSPWGYYALAETLEERHQYQAIVDELAPVVARTKGADAVSDASILLPHLGFAYQELGQYDKAIATFEEARRQSPKDPAVAGYLIDALIAAKKYSAAVDQAKAALAEHPDDVRLARLQAQALRHSGKSDQAVSVLEDAVKKNADDPGAYVALAELYSDLDRGTQAITLLKDAATKFPDDTTIAFEMGAVYDKQKNFPEAEAAFKRLLDREPQNAAALNYLGYMLAERGERLDESVSYLKKALQLEPENGSYLDSLGWAYFKSSRLDLAEDNLRRAADQLKMNSVIQDHYGEVLFKLGRFDEAIAAWTRALAGDGDSIDRGEIDKKIRAARQKLPKK